MSPRPIRFALLAACLAVLAAACGPKSPGPGASAPASTSAPPPATATTVRLGYLPQLTQASALVGIQDGYFTKEATASGITIQPSTYPTAAAEVGALTSGAIDAAYLDPNSAISAYESTNGGVKIISGATSGGSYLMTKYYPQKIAGNLRGGTIATPETGNDQDVALRAYLAANGLTGSVHVVYESNAAILQQYKSGGLTGAWVDEQWATRLQIEDDSNVFLEEGTLPQFQNDSYATAVLAVRTSYLQANPNAVTALLLGQVFSNEVVSAQSPSTENDAANAIDKLTGVTLSTVESELAWTHLTFTNDPIASSIETDAANAQKLGLVKSSNVSGIFSLTLLNEILQANGKQQVSAG